MLITVPAPGAPIRLGNRVYTRALTHSAACGLAGVPGPPSVMIRLAATLALALKCRVATRAPTRPGYAGLGGGGGVMICGLGGGGGGGGGESANRGGESGIPRRGRA